MQFINAKDKSLRSVLFTLLDHSLFMLGNMGEHFERISSAPRLSFSNQDVFNLRNSKLMQLSRSAPGICESVPTTPKSILLKPKQDSASEIYVPEEKVEEKSFRFELQFTAFVFFFFLLVIVTPISMIAIGSIYLHSCPVQIMIPVFLIAGGASFLCCIGFLKKLSTEEDAVCYRKTLSFAILFQLGWFIGGCYWIYGTYEPDYTNEGSATYCHKTLYLYSFWLLNTIFLSLAFFLVLFTVYVLFGRHQSETGTNV